MSNRQNQISNLIKRKNELTNQLSSFPFIGTPEVKIISNKKYLYVRCKQHGKVSSTYVGSYDPDLHVLLLKNAKEIKLINKELRHIEVELAKLGYATNVLSNKVLFARDFARKHRNIIIYDQAVLEGLSTTFPDTEDILENGIVRNAKVEDVTKTINLKHAWEYILDNDILSFDTDYMIVSKIADLVNEGLIVDGGSIRKTHVKIGGSTYMPPIPLEKDVIENVNDIVKSDDSHENIAVALCLYIMKKQIFKDGNKRTAVIAANHYLITKGVGILAIDFNKVNEFKKLLVKYYENTDINSVKKFLKECIMYSR